jgi:membrane-bound lytic murein transglycosylase D
VPSGRIEFRRIDPGAIITLLATIFVITAASPLKAIAATGFQFPRPPSIESNIQFWVDVFTTYTERDFVIHDRDQVRRVYQVLDLPGDGPPSRSEIVTINDYLKTKYSNILIRLASGQTPSDYQERQIAALFKGEPPSAFAVAAQNLRVQQGMREKFREGLLRSRYYRPTMERIFRAAGVPPELVILAAVESGFYSRAQSRAGAVGIWQFTRGTGKQFMRITRYHDDRFDPTTATEAAAKLLRSNYLTFGSWPLAITAYNYGTAGTAQAADAYNGDYDRIVGNYNGPHFGFASKNYYAEFLAALQVDEQEDQYFPDLRSAEAPPPPLIRTDFTPKGHLHGVRHAILHRSRHIRRHRREVAMNEKARASRRRNSAVVPARATRRTHRRKPAVVAIDDVRRQDS